MGVIGEKEVQKGRILQALQSDDFYTVIREARRLFPDEMFSYDLAGSQTISEYMEELKECIRDYCYNTALMSDVLIGYTYHNEWTRPYSWDFKVKSNYRVDFTIYYEGEPESTPYTYLSKETVDGIEKIMNEKRPLIDSLPKEASDWNIGGRYETFIFLDRKIRSINTTR